MGLHNTIGIKAIIESTGSIREYPKSTHKIPEKYPKRIQKVPKKYKKVRKNWPKMGNKGSAGRKLATPASSGGKSVRQVKDEKRGRVKVTIVRLFT